MIQNPIQVLTTNIAANLVNAGPSSGSPAIPTFRSLVVADIPSGIPFSTLSGAASNAQIPNGITNFNTAQQSQVVVSGTTYYITSSNLNVPASPVNGIVVGTTFKWRIVLNKTAAGTGTFQIVIFMGTNGSTADTAVVTQTIGTQTAVVDTVFIDVDYVVTSSGASGAAYWAITPKQAAAIATGFGVVNGSGGVFNGSLTLQNYTTSSLKFGLGFIATTGTPTITVPLVQAQAFSLD